MFENRIPVADPVLVEVAHGRYHSPHAVLGAHLGDDSVTIRTVRHLADAVTVITEDGSYPAEHEMEGVWVAVLDQTEIPDYRLEIQYGDTVITVDDPYRFLPALGEMDTYLIGEGRHEQLWEVLGAHRKEYDGPMGEVQGVAFAVWAPNARAVRVVGDFNFWDGSGSAMRTLGDSGVWELFIPDVPVGARYKFEIQGPDGNWFQKADPMARGTEVPPATASVVNESHYEWGDDEWMKTRGSRSPHSEPMSIYECHIGSWRQGLTYREFADELVPYLLDMGYQHV